MKPAQAPRTVLVLNFGSASLKAASYLLHAGVAGERPAASQEQRISVATKNDTPTKLAENAEALLTTVVERLPALREPPDIVAHRIVHGRDRPGPVELTQATRVELQALSTLAPLHQPPALALVQAATQRWPDAQQIGVFDTSWHQTMPERNRVLALPYSLYEAGVKRYGFHGLAFQSAMRQLSSIAPELAQGRIVLAHLGGGSSLCAVLGGLSVNTTMGMTPLGGIPMASRSGSLDPGVLLYLQREQGMSSNEIDQLLWRESGLHGLSGESGDMRKLLLSGSIRSSLAIDVYVTGVAQGIAAMAACIKGIDALIFTGGIGLHSTEIRARVAAELGWIGINIDPELNTVRAVNISTSSALAKTYVLQVDEEGEMFRAIAAVESQPTSTTPLSPID